MHNVVFGVLTEDKLIKFFIEIKSLFSYFSTEWVRHYAVNLDCEYHTSTSDVEFFLQII